MDLLVAVNRILPKVGEHPVTSLTSRSPTLGLLLPAIVERGKEVIGQGWWFNTSELTLFPAANGEIAVATDILSFVAHDYEVSARRGKLHNAVDNTFIWPVGVGIKGIAVYNVVFADLPESVASKVLYTALVDLYTTDIGRTKELEVWAGEVRVADARMLSEHLKNKRYTTQRSRRYQNYRRALRA